MAEYVELRLKYCSTDVPELTFLLRKSLSKERSFCPLESEEIGSRDNVFNSEVEKLKDELVC